MLSNEDLMEIDNAPSNNNTKLDIFLANINYIVDFFDKNEIDRIRNEIFFFASQCRHQVVPTADNFHHIFVIHDKYMELLKTNNLTNGQMDVDFTYIKDYYNKLSEEGKI